MKKLFDKLDKFIESAKSQSKSAAKQGAEILRNVADFLEGEVVPLFGAKKPAASDLDNEAKLDQVIGELEGCCEEVKGKDAPTGAKGQPKGISGPGIALLVDVLIQVFKAIRDRRKEMNAQPEEEEGAEEDTDADEEEE